MSTLYIDRSVRDGSRGDWVESLDLGGVDRIVVGTGPGSFAGVRSALAFAQGYALARPDCEVLGLPSACALAGDGPLAVVGDARGGRFWIALFDGFRVERDVFQVLRDGLESAVPADHKVATPDADRIDGLLRSLFGARYLGGRTPTADGLRRFAEANPAVLRHEPLPIYLNPAVRCPL
ncbi:MAG: hypothetical protein J6T51_01955 [Kiritimatiellae bacterium]|nr:hypothetical protein [Kiritimatiellia bacterium]